MQYSSSSSSNNNNKNNYNNYNSNNNNNNNNTYCGRRYFARHDSISCRSEFQGRNLHSDPPEAMRHEAKLQVAGTWQRGLSGTSVAHTKDNEHN
ncbi:hypothetical protein E2C01_059688 [Portunus trituberculatus]|uniref:Uncharacterized protein n=1 Tax=Portunus trituberculatus TaxID=210409 RepID=A0A5B7GZ29_PORTR|nr:hypothetical protein [Portunus trituberculatus]